MRGYCFGRVPARGLIRASGGLTFGFKTSMKAFLCARRGLLGGCGPKVRVRLRGLRESFCSSGVRCQF